MIQNKRKRQRRALVFEGLEARALLHAAVPTMAAAHIHALKASSTVITGTLHGQVTGATPVTPETLAITYIGQGKAKFIGALNATGSHLVTSLPGSKNSTNDGYANGSVTLTSATAGIVASYTGSGHTNEKTGKYTAKLQGSGVGVAGLALGKTGTLSGNVTGNARTGTFTFTFTIRA
jgi:hypothetical protein